MKYKLSRVVAGPFLHSLWRPQIDGAENIPETGGAILASNHLSIVDSIFLPLMLERPLTFAAKSEYFTSTRPSQRLAAAYLRATKQLSVDREGARAAAVGAGPRRTPAGAPLTCRCSGWRSGRRRRGTAARPGRARSRRPRPGPG